MARSTGIHSAPTFRRLGRASILLLTVPFAGLLLSERGATASDPQQPDARNIIERSVAANDVDWAAAPRYDFTERDRSPRGTKVFRVMMILGSPYHELIGAAAQPLSERQQVAEQKGVLSTIARRRAESPRQTAARKAQYQRDRSRDHLLMSQLSRAFDFAFVRREKLLGHDVFVLKATPRQGYHPPNTQTQVLTGMEGTLWIDTRTYQWVKVEAHVVHPVSIVGFLARVEPGTFFELERSPVAEGIWLPSHFAMRARAKVLYAFNHKSQEDETYYDYHPTPSDMQEKPSQIKPGTASPAPPER